MQIRLLKNGGLVFVSLMLFLLFTAAGVVSAAQKVPISFDDYHGYTGTVNYVKAVANAYPKITKLLEIGKSTNGRPIYVLVISNMKTGTTIDAHVKLRNKRKEGVKNVTLMKPYQGKPGFWLCGSTHGNEYTGTEVCLYSIDKLVSGYGADEEPEPEFSGRLVQERDGRWTGGLPHIGTRNPCDCRVFHQSHKHSDGAELSHIRRIYLQAYGNSTSYRASSQGRGCSRYGHGEKILGDHRR